MSNALCQSRLEYLLRQNQTKSKAVVSKSDLQCNPLCKGNVSRGTWPGEVRQYSQVMIRLKLGSLSCQTFPPTLLCRSLVWILNVNNITELILQMGTKL